jgi:hypothetical protein
MEFSGPTRNLKKSSGHQINQSERKFSQKKVFFRTTKSTFRTIENHFATFSAIQQVIGVLRFS